MAEEEDSDILSVTVKKGKRKYNKRHTNIDVEKVFDRPGKRHVAAPKKFEIAPVVKQEKIVWTLEEKKQLLEAIKKYTVNDVENIDRCIPTKSRQEWQQMVRYLKHKHKRKNKQSEDFIAPIEIWLKTATDITQLEPDYSSELAEVVSIAGSLEPHDPPRINCSFDPDWNKIYQYLAGLLQGDKDLHENLSSVEAAVVLDILQNLSDHLNSLDTSDQRELMRRKYQQLSKNFVAYSTTGEIEALTHGLEKDPLEEDISEFEPNGVENSTSLASGSGTSSNQQPCTSSTSNESSSVTRKSTLFTINPFSIPVKYLKPDVGEGDPANKQ